MLAVLALYGVLLWHDPWLFWNDDYELSILPVFADVARGWSEGHLPLLSPYSWICSNLAGEFQYGTFSIFVNAVVVLIWKLPLTFPQQAAALSMSHLAVLAAGGYVLARGRNLRPALALMVALVAAANGWMVCWGATDWFGSLGAFAWLPWAWWGLERALDPLRGRWRWIWPAPFVYLLITGGFPYTVVMLAVLICWLAVRSWSTTGKLASVWLMMFGAAVGTGMAAPAWLALLDYVHGSARQAQETAVHFQWLVPPAALPAFFMPNWTVKWADFSNRMTPHAATEMACGFAAPVILLHAFLARGRSLLRHLRWEFALLAIVILLSTLPTTNVFRWSFRWLPFVHLVLVISAAESVRYIAAERKIGSGYQSIGSVGFLAAIAGAIAMLLVGAGGVYLWPLTAMMIGLGAIWFAVDCLLQGDSVFRAWTPCAITFAAFVATYLCVPPNCGVPRYNLDSKLNAIEPLDPQRLYLSLYPAPEQTYRTERNPAPFGTVVRPGSTSMWAGARFINGYSPIRPSGVARELQSDIHGEIPWEVANQLLTSQAGAENLLSEMGVDGVI
ncbi:MAG: hypothetical protein H0U99_09185, partial [Chthoniobacterales bacterium]|nr:hypothetical protein [Chthoniobacterales bacterium]